jgi:hypothetical protein
MGELIFAVHSWERLFRIQPIQAFKNGNSAKGFRKLLGICAVNTNEFCQIMVIDITVKVEAEITNPSWLYPSSE